MRSRVIGRGAPRRVPRRLRVFALMFALLQLGLQGAFAISDGYAERDAARDAAVHAESPWHGPHRAHGDDCAVCHVLASGADVPPRPPVLLPDAARPLTAPAAALDTPPRAESSSARLARAPPRAV